MTNDDAGQERKSEFMREMLFGAKIASLIILAGFVVVIVLLFFVEVPESSRQLVAGMVGTIQTLAILAAGYWLQQRMAARQAPPPPLEVKSPPQ